MLSDDEIAKLSEAKAAVNTKRPTKAAIICLCSSFDVKQQPVYAYPPYFEIVGIICFCYLAWRVILILNHCYSYYYTRFEFFS